MLNGFRKGIDKESIVKSLSDEDWQFIKDMKTYEDMKKDSYRGKVLLSNDQLRMIRDTCYYELTDCLNTIKNLSLTIKRYNIQICTGTIIEQVSEGKTMTKDELELVTMKMKNNIFKLSKEMMLKLKVLSSLINQKDLAKIIILTEEQFDDRVKYYETELDKLGIKLFEQ